LISRITSHIDQLREIIQTLLQSVGALLVAWSGYQASQWSSVQSTANSASIRRTTEAAQEATLAGQDRLVDLVAYEKWLDAVAAQNALLADSHRDRFRAEFKPAFDAWLRDDPLNDPGAAESPFVLPEHILHRPEASEALDAEAEQLARQAAQASNNSSQYICYTLWFATAIFFAGISRAFKRLALQIATPVMSFVLILMGALQLLVAPTA
jgi:hypothetical protein